MTDDVARLVLRDNYEQNVLLGNARVQAPAMLSVHERLHPVARAARRARPALEFLPPRPMIATSALAAGAGPDLQRAGGPRGVLQDHADRDRARRPTLPDDPWFVGALRRYFPHRLVRRLRRPARRATRCAARSSPPGSSTTWSTAAGMTFVFRAQEETGASPIEIVRAYAVVREVFRPRRLLGRGRGARQPAADRRAVDALPGGAAAARPQHPLAGAGPAGEHRRRAPRSSTSGPTSTALVAAGAGPARRGRARAAADAGRRVHRARRPRRPGRAARPRLLDTFSLLDVVEIATAEKLPAEEVAAVYFAISERHRGRPDAHPDHRSCRATTAGRALARSALRYDLYAALAGLTSNVLTSTSSADEPAVRIAAWEQANSEGVARAQATLDEIIAPDHVRPGDALGRPADDPHAAQGLTAPRDCRDRARRLVVGQVGARREPQPRDAVGHRRRPEAADPHPVARSRRAAASAAGPGSPTSTDTTAASGAVARRPAASRSADSPAARERTALASAGSARSTASAAAAPATAAGARPVSKMNGRAVLTRCSTTTAGPSTAPPCAPSDLLSVTVRTTSGSPARPAACAAPAPLVADDAERVRLVDDQQRTVPAGDRVQLGERRQVAVDARTPRR